MIVGLPEKNEGILPEPIRIRLHALLQEAEPGWPSLLGGISNEELINGRPPYAREAKRPMEA